MKKVLSIILVLAILAACVWVIYGLITNSPETETPTANEERVPVEKEEVADINSVHLRDNPLLYETDAPDVITMYLTVSRGNESDGTDHSWAEINTYSSYYYEERGIDRYKVNAILQVGDETGPIPGAFGYGVTVPNAFVQVRGQTSTRYSQKNYKIELFDTGVDYNGTRTIALNKHMSEGLRFRNKLSFDLLSEIPQIMSLRTQFVHLYVKDLTESANAVFKDYGLYTQVEQLNKTAMKAHGLDKNGYLYKINYCEFYEYEDLRLVTDPLYDQAKFDLIMETKGRNDHDKLLEMLEAVNNYNINSDDLLDKYFDRENLAYWMGFMILTGNADTQSRNMYIYSPLNSDKWYILPWDNDASLMDTENDLRNYVDNKDWQVGISNYWGNMLFRRALLTESFRKELDDAINDMLKNYLTEEHVAELAEKYASIVYPYIYRMPDIMHAPLKNYQYEDIVNAISKEIAVNYEEYKRSLLSPMPFFIGAPEVNGNTVHFSWDRAIDLRGQDIKYNVVVSKDYNRQNVLFAADGLKLTGVDANIKLAPGQYFLHVDATNDDGNTTNCFEFYEGVNGKIYGEMSFFVNADGSITVYEVLENE